MTNYERIKDMGVNEMANFLHIDCDGACECCVFNRNTNCYENADKCKLGIREWLESEVEE